ncbi:DUF6207 family protein (plasmid) [Streptomyces sp. NBC_00868]|uniref:DUF6207 family protein n=1 Tax=Streptomyces sp. NBC_00868 TaxID=2903683 RepID=UPI00386387C2|nr:DUF6207 family protein [Streptomyces sp. NBC_00868]
MKPIDEQHIAEPGLVVLDITGGDEDTVRAVMAALEERWATSGLVPMYRDPGEPGVRGLRRHPASGAGGSVATARHHNRGTAMTARSTRRPGTYASSSRSSFRGRAGPQVEVEAVPVLVNQDRAAVHAGGGQRRPAGHARPALNLLP